MKPYTKQTLSYPIDAPRRSISLPFHRGNTRVIHEWRNRVCAEYNSANITTELVQGLIRLGAPVQLIDAALRIIRDELDHARLSFVVLQAIDKSHECVEIPMVPPLREDMLQQVLRRTLENFCFGETLAVPLFHAMYREAKHPQAREALERILQDEARHRAFGWQVLDFLCTHYAKDTRAYIVQDIPRCIYLFSKAYSAVQKHSPLRKDERELGLIDIEEYQRIWEQAYEKDIRARFEKRGITTPDLQR